MEKPSLPSSSTKSKQAFLSARSKRLAFGDRRKAILQDIAILTGATVISSEVGLSLDDIELSMLGRAKKIKIAKETTTIIDGAGNAKEIEKRIKEIRAEIANIDFRL